jgi:ubiquitin-like domain-containing CTD phosphatase 1
MTNHLFHQIVENVEYDFANLALYDQSAYAKAAMSKLLSSVRSNIIDAMNSNNTSSIPDTSHIKFALFSGHDTTLMPVLAALLEDHWDRKWAAYASMVTIELYASSDNKEDLFRIVYNGVN